MSVVLSREYMRNLPVLRRQQQTNELVQGMYQSIIPFVTNAAARGDTHYLYDMTTWREQNRNWRDHYRMVRAAGKGGFEGGGAVPSSEPQYQIDEMIDEIVEGLKEKFPDCLVNFLEDWVGTQKGVRVLKKCIKIHWS